MKLIRMCSKNEDVNERSCSWWIDNRKPLIKCIPHLQQYNKENCFIIAEIDDDVINNGDGYCWGNDDILKSHDSHGTTGMHKSNPYTSISKLDSKYINILYKGEFKVWTDLFQVAASNGFITGV